MHLRKSHGYVRPSARAVARGGAGGASAPPIFDSSVNPISTRGGADYAHHITTSPPGFSDLATALHNSSVHVFDNVTLDDKNVHSFYHNFV